MDFKIFLTVCNFIIIIIRLPDLDSYRNEIEMKTIFLFLFILCNGFISQVIDEEFDVEYCLVHVLVAVVVVVNVVVVFSPIG